MKKDTQVVELLGRNLLVAELLKAGLEVALPIRDRGIDLIAYADKGDGVSAFGARPIQMKAASVESFSLHSKFAEFPGLLIAYVWNVADPGRTVTYALTHAEALGIAGKMGFTEAPVWRTGSHSCTRIGKRLRGLMEPFQMTPEKWRTRVRGAP